jgi:hypothetical protein
MQQRQLSTPESMHLHCCKHCTTPPSDNIPSIYKNNNINGIIVFEGSMQDISTIMHNNQSQDNKSNNNKASGNNKNTTDLDSKISATSTNNTTLQTISKNH